MNGKRVIAIGLVLFAALHILGFSVFAQDRGAGVKSNEKRLALVIGNGNYQHTASLNNPVNDATDMTKTLRELGFEVISGTNQSLAQMRKLLREFGAKLKQDGGVGLFYYAGHAVQVNGRNFLIPVDADIASEVETEDVAFDVNSVLRQMDAAGNGFNIVILDSCRNNPFARSWNRDAGSGGLAQINAPNGTFIAYSTSPDRTASDGAGRNGLYTAELLKHLKTNDLKIEEAFKEVGKAVNRQSGGKQVPWVSSSLQGDFYFLSTGKVNTFSAPTQSNVPPPNKTPENLDAAQYFEIARAFSIRGDLERALVEVNRAIAISPNYTTAYILRAGIYHLKNMHEQSIADCNKAIELKTDTEFAYIFRGYSYNVTGKNELALADFNKALQINPQSAMAFSGRGVYYSNTKNYPKALSDLTQGIKLGSVDSKNFYNRGAVYAHLQDYDRAIEDLTKAIELEPTLAIAYFNRSVVYERKGDKTRADADKKKYFELIGVQ